jgi:hypothetical protein
MIKLDNNNVIFFDVDDTLIHWSYPPEREGEALDIGINGSLLQGRVVPHRVHIERLKRYKIIGAKVVVWSRSGWDWADAVVKALQLEDYVDIVMSKPKIYYDDKTSDQFMGEHRYFEDVLNPLLT